jgi:hypothetical protein
MAAPQASRRRLTLAVVSNEHPVRQELVGFCSHCGAHPEQNHPDSRVCPSCELGLVITSSVDAAPGPGDAFLVLDSSLAVCAVSGAAESLLATRETDAVNRHITELIVPADAEAKGAANLAVAVTWAARGDGTTRRLFVRPANTFGVRMPVRISSCGPPKAAVILFD